MKRKIAWNTTPLLVGTVTTRTGLKLLGQRMEQADLLEVRVDALLAAGLEPEHILTFLRQRKNPVLLTLRLPEEGGVYAWAAGEREALLTGFLPDVEAVDVELASRRELARVLKLVEDSAIDLVLSAHALRTPVSSSTLAGWVRSMRRLRPTIAKIAAHLETRDDLLGLARLLCQKDDQKWAVMGLGPHGPLSRTILGTLGSALVYGYLDRAAAPGQPSVKQLAQVFRSQGWSTSFPVT